MKWEEYAVGVKMLNNVNSENGKWKGRQVRYNDAAEAIAEAVHDIAINHDFIRHTRNEKQIER